MNIFVTSDHHFWHSNIIKYCNRPFSNINDMEKMVDYWNEVVKPEDVVYHLGDFCFAKRKNGYDVSNLLKRLNGRKYLICGNHDNDTTKNSPEWVEVYQKYNIINYNNYNILMIHYPIWKECFKNKRPNKEFDVCFYGHVHNNDWNIVPPKNYYNVSVEVTNYRPVNIEEYLK